MDLRVALTICIAIVAAGLIQNWIERRKAGSLSAIQKEKALKPPQSVDEYVRIHYGGAYNA